MRMKFRYWCIRLSSLFLGQGEYELQSASLVVLGGDGTAVDEDGVFHDGKSQSRASQLA